MAIRSFADDAREHVTIELWLNDTPLGHIHLEASDAEHFIHDLAKNRAALREEVTPMLDPGARLEAVVDPAWHVSRQKDGGHVLALRHPGFGWLSFVLSDEDAREMAMALAQERGKGCGTEETRIPSKNLTNKTSAIGRQTVMEWEQRGS